MTDIRPDDLMHEDEVYERYGKLFAERELREARKNGEIGWFNTRKGPYYSVEQVMAYLKSKECLAKCQPENEPLDPDQPVPAPQGRRSGSSKSVTTGSVTRMAPKPSSITGMTGTLEKRAAEQLDAEI